MKIKKLKVLLIIVIIASLLISLWILGMFLSYKETEISCKKIASGNNYYFKCYVDNKDFIYFSDYFEKEECNSEKECMIKLATNSPELLRCKEIVEDTKTLISSSGNSEKTEIIKAKCKRADI